MQNTGSKCEEIMEIITAILTVIAGFVFRLAIPIAITAVAIYFLRRLDTRLKVEVETQLLQPVVEKPKCWEIHGCSAEMRATCSGCQSEQPCWQALRKDNGYLQDRCLGCDVFRKAPIPTKI
jgi:hypothetical protein